MSLGTWEVKQSSMQLIMFSFLNEPVVMISGCFYLSCSGAGFTG